MNRTVISFLVVLSVAFGFIFWGNRQKENQAENQDITQMCVQHQGVGIHIHPHLKIVIKGEEEAIPVNIGIVSPVCMRPIHTHDANGTLHVEFPKPRDVRLTEFFLIWGKQFNSNQIFDFQNGPEGQVKMFINGQENMEFENYIMKDLDQILIMYE